MKAAPHDIENDKALVGSILVSAPAMEAALKAGVQPGDFHHDRHRTIYRAVLALHEAGVPVDEITVNAELERNGTLSDVGGKNTVSELAATTPAPGNAPFYASRVREIGRRNAAIDIAAQIDQAARNGHIDAKGTGLAVALRETVTELTARRLPAKLLTIEDLNNLPDPSYLVQDFILENGLNMLFGPSGAGKSFFALDLALCVAAGLPWYGQQVIQGTVVYVAAEGSSGYRKRIAAWQKARHTPSVPEFRLYTEPVNLFTGETAAFETALGTLPKPPDLLIFDTLARCIVGGDENLAKDTGLFIDNLDRLARQFGCAALFVHHTGKNGELERGSSALKAGVDVAISIKPDGAALKLTSVKQKDAPDFDPWTFHLEEFAESAVIRPGGDLGRFSEQEDQILTTVSESFGTEWASTSKIKEVADLPKTTFYRTLKALVDRDLMEERHVGAQRKEYRLTPDSSTVPNRSKPSQETAQNRPSSHTPLGVGLGTGGTGAGAVQ